MVWRIFGKLTFSHSFLAFFYSVSFGNKNRNYFKKKTMFLLSKFTIAKLKMIERKTSKLMKGLTFSGS